MERIDMKQEKYWENYVDTVGKNEEAIKNYIKNQLKEDMMVEQLSMDKMDPFTGSQKQCANVGSYGRFQAKLEHLALQASEKNHQFYWWIFTSINKTRCDSDL